MFQIAPKCRKFSGLKEITEANKKRKEGIEGILDLGKVHGRVWRWGSL